MPVMPSESFLTEKKGPLPVWGWGLLGLIIAYAYSRYRANKTAATTTPTATSAAAQPASSATPFIIENNLPPVNVPTSPGTTSVPSSPVPSPAPPPPTVTPGGTSTTPPVTGGGPAITPATNPGPQPTFIPSPVPKAPVHYKVIAGDTLSRIASKYNTSWQNLWNYNTTPGNRPASTIATLKQRGPNLIYPGETILIPQ